MANRIIINNKTDLTDFECLSLIKEVVELGRISNNNKQYCYYSVFDVNGKEFKVATDLRKNSDSFTII